MRSRLAPFFAIGLLISGSAFAADGLVLPRSGAYWPQWQARISISAATLSPVSLTAALDAASGRTGVQSGAVLGDWYVDAPGLRVASLVGGLRATGGLLSGVRGMALGSTSYAWRSGSLGIVLQGGMSPPAREAAGETLPYLGMGYTGQSLKGGWGVSADLGLVAERAGAARGLFGNSGWDNTLREMRLSPVLQLGLTYAF